MRIANLDGRLVLKYPDGVTDVEKASDGRFAADPQAVFARWDEFVAWAGGLRAPLIEPFDESRLQAPAPRPSQVFAIGLNYADHAGESKMELPPEPSVFTKFQTSIAGPNDAVKLPTATVDWEAELVVVIGRRAVSVDAARAWDHVAGVTLGQDLSERTRQLVGTPPQFSIGKSFPGFAPIGPEIVTPDELADRDDLEIGCSINGEIVQHAGTSDLIFSVASLIERLSAILPLTPGDIIFTGTPSGVGHAHGVWVCTLTGHVIALVDQSGRLAQISTGDGHPVACCLDTAGRLFVTVAETGGAPILEAVANKTLKTHVDVYEPVATL